MSRSISADDQLVLVLRADGEEVAARIDEVGRAVEPADVPGRLGADAVAARHEVAVGDRVRRLLELPEVLREAGDGGRRVEDDLGAVQAEQPRALREVAVVADVDADRRVARLEHGISEVARLEEVLLPEPAVCGMWFFRYLPEVRCRRRRRRRRCCSRRPPARARRPGRPSPSGTSSRTPPSARWSARAPARRCRTSARSCDGQKYGPLKISCRPRICTPFVPASSMSGRCASIAASRTSSIGAAGSVSGAAAWIRPPRTLRGMRLHAIDARAVRLGPTYARR